MAHARLAPSAAARWSVCTASVSAIEDAGYKNTSSLPAATGSLLHAMSEALLLRDTEAYSKLVAEHNYGGYNIELTPEHFEWVNRYVDEVEARIGPDDIVMVEKSLSLFYAPDEHGTSDIVIVRPFEYIEIIDAKFGQGIRVDVHDNPQFEIYGGSALEEYAKRYFVDFIRCTVVQPPFGNVDSQDYSVAEMRERIEHYRAQAEIVDDPERRVFVAGPHCKKSFCPHRAKCSELQTVAQQTAKSVFGTPAPVADDNLGDSMTLVPILEDWIKEVKAATQEALKTGVPVPGFKLVAGRRARKWRDEEQVVEHLRTKKVRVADIYDTKIRSVAQMEKRLTGGVDLSDFIETTEGKPTVAPESDKRPALGSSADLVFEKLK